VVESKQELVAVAGYSSADFRYHHRILGSKPIAQME
jgi:hypothetical protein